MNLTVSNGVITGSMSDLRPQYDWTIQEYLRMLKPMANASWRLKMNWRLAALMSPKTVVRMSLPTQSAIEGHVKGDLVVFTKTYLGKSVWAFDNGKSSRSFSRDCAVITYMGRLDPDGTTIRGTYEFPLGTDQAGDAFVLSRQD
jgi:hypothetical protein